MSIKFEKYNTPEFNVIKDVFAEYPLLDPYLAHMVEEYLYTTVREYYSNGQLQKEYRVKGDKRDGEYKEWDRYGKLCRQEFYKEGKREGKIKVWYRGADGRVNEQLYIQCYYKEGKREGELKTWYDNGQLWEQEYYKNGELEGERKVWHDNGKLDVQEYYKNGKVKEKVGMKTGNYGI